MNIFMDLCGGFKMEFYEDFMYENFVKFHLLQSFKRKLKKSFEDDTNEIKH